MNSAIKTGLVYLVCGVVGLAGSIKAGHSYSDQEKILRSEIPERVWHVEEEIRKIRGILESEIYHNFKKPHFVENYAFNLTDPNFVKNYKELLIELEKNRADPNIQASKEKLIDLDAKYWWVPVLGIASALGSILGSAALIGGIIEPYGNKKEKRK